MKRIWLVIATLGLAGCTASPWAWQDLRTPARPGPETDLDACRSYAAAQYKPGIPAGTPYLDDHPAPPPLDQEDQGYPPGTGTWHPDREPFPYTNRSGGSVHGVVVPYTGYPGGLDYNPGYLDALVEKCMADRGWAYRPVAPPAK